MLLVCSAWDEEIKKLKASYPVSKNYQLSTLGIGYLQAALSLQEILASNKQITEILFLGTAGAYAQNLKIGDITKIKNTALLNIGEVLNTSYIPKDYENFTSTKITQENFTEVTCLSSLEITKDAELSKKIIQHYDSSAILVENMELYGVAKVANSQEIPWSALLGITNYTNANAHADWQVNHQAVSASLCDAISRDLLYV